MQSQIRVYNLKFKWTYVSRPLRCSIHLSCGKCPTSSISNNLKKFNRNGWGTKQKKKAKIEDNNLSDDATTIKYEMNVFGKMNKIEIPYQVRRSSNSIEMQNIECLVRHSLLHCLWIYRKREQIKRLIIKKRERASISLHLHSTQHK